MPEQVAPNASTAAVMPDAAGGDDRLVEIDAGVLERRLQRVALLPRAVGVEQLALRQVLRARDMAGRTPGRGSGSSPVKRAGRSRIDHLLGLRAQIVVHLRERADAFRSAQTVNWRWRSGLAASISRPSACHLASPPSRIATSCAPKGRSIHHARAAVWSGRIVVEHDAAAVAEAERLHPAGELLGRGSILGSELLVSASSSRSMNTAPEYAPPRIRPRVARRAGENRSHRRCAGRSRQARPPAIRSSPAIIVSPRFYCRSS